MSIVFKADDHTYRNKKTGERYTSVSGVLSNFKPSFNKDFWSTYVAFKRILGKSKLKKLSKGFSTETDEMIIHLQQYVDDKELTSVRKAVLKEWEFENKKSINKGNEYHKKQEKNHIQMVFK